MGTRAREPYGWKVASTRARLIIAMYALAFGVGTVSHAIDIVGAWPPYTGYPLALRTFWTALLPIDLVLVIAVFARTLPATAAASLIMLVDVVVNTYATYAERHIDFWRNPGLWSQSGFFVFTLCAAPFLWRDARASESSSRRVCGRT